MSCLNRSAMYSQYKCIIFDCDGVLVDSIPITNQALLDLLRPLGMATEFEKVIHEYRGTSLSKAFSDIETMTGDEVNLWIERLRPIRLEIHRIDMALRKLT